MQFTYVHGIPTVEQAMAQAVGFFIRSGNGLVVETLAKAVHEVASLALTEIRNILTSEMTTLLDMDGVAADWNAGVEKAIQCVEGSIR